MSSREMTLSDVKKKFKEVASYIKIFLALSQIKITSAYLMSHNLSHSCHLTSASLGVITAEALHSVPLGTHVILSVSCVVGTGCAGQSPKKSLAAKVHDKCQPKLREEQQCTKGSIDSLVYNSKGT